MSLPLCTIAKQIHRKWSEKYAENKFVIMFGSLHIEMAALNTAGDCVKGSGWTHAVVQAEISTAWAAEPFIKAPHVAHTRQAHQIKAASLQLYAYEYVT